MRAALLVLVLSACSPSPFLRHELVRRPWHELTTPHFVLTTDLPLATARQRIAALETQFWLLADNYALLLPGEPPTRPLLVTLFADCKDYRAVATWEEASGFATETQEYERRPVFVSCNEFGREHLLMHELSHLFNGTMIGWTPIWLNEGLAEYFSSLVIEDGQVVLGKMPPMAHIHWQFVWRLDSYGDLMTRNAIDFYGKTGVRRYLAAWKLVHLLANASDEHQRRFRVYLGALAAGVVRDEAWRTAFGDWPAGKITADYKAYDLTGEVRLWRAPHVPHAPVAPQERELSPGEIHGFWVAMQLLRLNDFDRDSRDVSPMLAHLDWAGQDEPAWSGAHFWRGVVLGRFPGHTDEAIAELRAYLRLEPDDARGWLALLAIELERAGGLDLALQTPAKDLSGLEADARALLRLARTSAQLEAVARYHAMAHRRPVAINFAERALALDRSCGPCLETLAALAFQAGDALAARAFQERAVETAIDVAVPEAMRRRWERYRAASVPASLGGAGR